MELGVRIPCEDAGLTLDREDLLPIFFSSLSLALVSEDDERLDERAEGALGSVGPLNMYEEGGAFALSFV
jgi:hypothetical protein